MQLALGSALATRSYSDPELAAAYDRARELCELLGNDQRVAQSLGGLSVYYINRGEIALGAELAERVLAIAEAHARRPARRARRGPAQPGPQLAGAGRRSRWTWPPGRWPTTTPRATGCSAAASAPTRASPPTCSPAGASCCSASSTGVSATW